LAFAWSLFGGNAALAFDFHDDTAHGNADFGVHRRYAPYPQGDCTHCHDTFDEAICGNPLMLFSTPLYTQQNIGFCIECHKAIGNSAQGEELVDTMPNQYSYSTKFGGGTDTCPAHIKQAFNFVKENGNSRPALCSSNDGSAHHLTSIRNFLQSRWGFSDSLDEINPCDGCHNPHKAQQHDYPVGAMGTSPISLPSTHDGTWDVWGAAASERMDTYLVGSEIYMAPYYYNAGGKHEPEKNYTNDGSNLPDYVTFCTDCHNSSTVIYSEELDRDLYQFDWATEKHGGGAASDNTNYYDLRSPYSESQSGMYVLSCTDCHEPHGSPNSFLTRKWVNGSTASLIEGSPNDWRTWCRRCHNQMSHLPEDGPHDTALGCTTCHPLIQDPPGVGYNCYSPSLGCHRHGSGLGGL
ncbi:MAG: hypothetical protein JRI70_10715, partial [Deltaproteobacteria bacterium]|nr:hypothetical protein [Deltaproteobacteria bacterium]